MIRLIFTTFAFLILLSHAAFAKDWMVETDHSKLSFFFEQLGVEKEGAFKEFESTVTFDPSDLANSHISVTIKIDSVDTKSHERDTNITSKDWFDAVSHPTALFEIEEVIKDGTERYFATAFLSMRGIKKRVTLPFQVIIENDNATAKGELIISRTDFGIGQGQWATDSVVGDRVRISFDLKSHEK